MNQTSIKYATMRRLLHLSLLLLFLPFAGRAADFYWAGTVTSNQWGTVGNWQSPLGTPATVLPGASDRVIFTNLGTSSFVIINVAVDVQKIEIRANARPTTYLSSLPITLRGYTDGLGFEMLKNVTFSATGTTIVQSGFRQTVGNFYLGGNTTHYITGAFTLGIASGANQPSFYLQPGNTLVMRTNITVQPNSTFFADDNTFVRLEKESGDNTITDIRISDDLSGASFTCYNLIINTGSAPEDRVRFLNSSLITARNNVELVNGRAIKTGGTTGGIRIYGNLISSFGSLAASSTIDWYFYGDNAQTISLAGTDIDKLNGDFTIDKGASTQTVTLLTPLTLNAAGQTFNFITGRVVTTTTNILTFAGTAVAAGFSNNSYVEGPVAKVGNTIFTFPIGKAGIAAPLHISGSGGVTSGLGGGATYIAEYFRANPATAGLDPNSVTAPLTNASECEYWTLNRTAGGAASNALVWLSYEDVRSCGVTSVANLRVGNWPSGGSSWIDRGGVAQTVGAYSFIGTSGTLVAANLPNYTLASLDETLNPLPVNWLNFTGRFFEGKVDLNWETAVEKDNDVYTVERSATGHGFDAIGTVPGRGTTSLRSSYAFTDNNPLDGENYYRIKQTDFDGKFTYSSVIRVIATNGTSTGLRLFPNPAISSQQVTLENTTLRNKKVALTIVSSNGVVVRQEQVTFGNDSRLKVNISNLKKGSYFIRISDGDKKLVSPVVVQ